MNSQYNLENNNFAKKKNHLLSKILIISGILIVVASLVFGITIFIVKSTQNKVTLKSIKKAWNSYDYQKIYELSKAYLNEYPYNNTAITYYSYACFFLSQSQTDTLQAQTYLDECINNLRIAMYSASPSLTPQLQYMLGCAYFYKNTITTHYYADLAVKYLLLAQENGYESDDIPEYLGLSYASLDMTMESIKAFTKALLVRESDSLLLSIAEQYNKAEEYDAAVPYLFRIIKNSKNEEVILKSQILLGNIYIAQGKLEDAMQEFNNVLKKNENSADAHYGIGVIYEMQGNIVKARAEWRTALKFQVNHPGALQKMSNN